MTTTTKTKPAYYFTLTEARRIADGITADGALAGDRNVSIAEAKSAFCAIQDAGPRRRCAGDNRRLDRLEAFTLRAFEEQEEAAYLRWILDDGPAKAEATHRELADAGLAALDAAGWRPLERRMVRRSFSDFEIVEAVVRRGDELRVIRWHPFNKGWMTPSPSGGEMIFDGEKV